MRGAPKHTCAPPAVHPPPPPPPPAPSLFSHDSEPSSGCDFCLTTTSLIPCPSRLQLDKQSGQPLRDGPTMLSWERKLRNMCARLGAKFVYYKPDGGVWKFEVGVRAVYPPKLLLPCCRCKAHFLP